MSIVNVQFKSGQDESLDPKNAPPGTVTSLVNAYFAKPNEVRKRPGMLGLQPFQVDGVTDFKAAKVFARGEALCAVSPASGGTKVYAHIETMGRWRETESSPEFTATWEIKVDSHASVATPGIAYLGGYVFLAWRSGDENSGLGTRGDVYLHVYELETGAVVIPTQRLATNGRTVRIIACSQAVIVSWLENAASPYDLKGVYVTLSTLTASAPITVAAGIASAAISPGPWYDVCWDAFGSKVYWAWNDGAGISMADGDQSLATNAPNAYGCPGLATAISICPMLNGGRVAISYRDEVGPGSRLGVYDFGSVATVVDNANALGHGPVCTHPSDDKLVGLALISFVTGGLLVWDAYAGAAYTDVAGVEGMAVSRPFFSAEERLYAAFMVNRASVSASTGAAQSLVVAEAPLRAYTGVGLPAIMAAHVAPRLFGDFSFCAIDVAKVGTDDYLIASGTSTDYWILTTTQFRQSFQVSRLKAGLGRSITLPGGLSVHAGGYPWWFDGEAVADIGFVGLKPSLGETGAGGLGNGTYLVSVVYERRDATGLLHRSEPYQESITVAAGPNRTINVTPYHTCVMSKTREPSTANLHRSTWLSIFATDVNGTLLYRVSKEPGFRSTVNDTTLVGGPSATPVGHDGTFPQGPRQLIYTTGGVLPDVAPPAFGDIITHRGRIFGVSGDLKTIWFSKRFTDDDTVFPGFNELLTIRSEHPVVALASHDTLLLIITTRGLYFVDGDGPGPTGVGGEYDNPRRMNVDVEGNTPHSVVSTSVGTFFQGSDGKLYLARGLEAVYIGRQIEDTLASYPIIRAAFVLEKQRQVRFVCTDFGNTAGVVLAMDLDLKQWSRYTYSFVPIHGCAWNDRMVLVSSAGAVFRESTTAWYDETYSGTKSWVGMQLETAWMSFAEAAGAQFTRRVNTVGERRSAHGMTMELAVDYGSYAQTATFTEADVGTNLDRVNVHVGSQNGMSARNRALRVRLTDTAPSVYGTGEGARWGGLGIDVDPMQGLARQGANARKK